MIPLITFFKGNSEYLNKILEFASKNNNVILLGDQHYNQNSNIKFVPISSLENINLYNFKKNYVHMSSNNYEIELQCFERFFYLHAFMKKQNINKCFFIDGDILLVENLPNDVEHLLKKNLAILSFEKNFETKKAISSHISAWTINGLNSFTNFLNEVYENKNDSIFKLLLEKQRYHIKHYKPGGVCDMTLIYYWYKKNGNILNFMNLYSDKYFFDMNLNSSDNYDLNEFEYMNGYKKIRKINNKFFIKNKKNSKDLLVIAIHFQGRSKKFINSFISNFFRYRLFLFIDYLFFYPVYKFMIINKTRIQFFLKKNLSLIF